MVKEIWLILFMILVFSMYNLYVLKKYGTFESISKSYDKLTIKEKPLFFLFCLGIGIPLFLIDVNILSFIMGVGIVSIGILSIFDFKDVRTFHNIVAILIVLISQISIIFIYNAWPFSIIFLLFSLKMWINKTNALWYIQIMAFIVYMYVIIFNIVLNI